MSRRSARNHKNDGLRSRGLEPCQLDRTPPTGRRTQRRHPSLPLPTNPISRYEKRFVECTIVAPTNSSSPSSPSPRNPPSRCPRTAIPPTHRACGTSPTRRSRASTRSSCLGRSGRSHTRCHSSRRTRPSRTRHAGRTMACSRAGCCNSPNPPASRPRSTHPAPSPRPPAHTTPDGSASPRHTKPSTPTTPTSSTQTPRPRTPPPRSARFPRTCRTIRHEAVRIRPASGKVRTHAPRSRTTPRPTKASMHPLPPRPSIRRPAEARRPGAMRRSGHRRNRHPERSFARLRGRRHTPHTASRPGNIRPTRCERQTVPLRGVPCLAG
jgi:hypothetical protein